MAATAPAKQRYSYECPRCKGTIATATRDGRIDNRRNCGHTFSVAAGEVVIDNRRQCGHCFTVAAGAMVSRETTRKDCFTYACPECGAEVLSGIRDGRVDNRRRCQHRGGARANIHLQMPTLQTKSSFRHTCWTRRQPAQVWAPICGCCGRGGARANIHIQMPTLQKKVHSDIRDGRVDNRRQCGHQFTVAAGAVVGTEAVKAQTFTYKCPRCGQKVRSGVCDGRIDNRRNCGHQFTVAAGAVVKSRDTPRAATTRAPKERTPHRWRRGPKHDRFMSTHLLAGKKVAEVAAPSG